MFSSLLHPSHKPSPGTAPARSAPSALLGPTPRVPPARGAERRDAEQREAGPGAEHFFPERYALGFMTILHYTDCPCDCHRRLRSIKTNHLIAGRCANLSPCLHLMLFGNTFKGKQTLGGITSERCMAEPQWPSLCHAETGSLGTARQCPGSSGAGRTLVRPTPSSQRRGAGRQSQGTSLPPVPPELVACCLPRSPPHGTTEAGFASRVQVEGNEPSHGQNKEGFTPISRKQQSLQPPSAAPEHAKHVLSQRVAKSQQSHSTGQKHTPSKKL